MLELVYISHACEHFSQQKLVDLLTISRKKNAKSDITGMLLYDGFETFIQALEGLEDEVERVFEKISSDSRHRGVKILWKRKIETRNFPDWQMGFQDIRKLNLNDLQGYSDFMQNNNENTHSSNNVTFAKELLRQFKRNILI